MARRSSGCLPVLVLLLAPCLLGYAIGLPVLALAAPALVPYVYLHDPAQFAEHRTLALSTLAAAPVLAFLLVRWASPVGGRLRGNRTRPAPAPAKGRFNPRARQPRPVRGYLGRIVLLLSATSTTALWLLLRSNDARGPQAMQETLTLVGGVAGATVVVLFAIRRWDRPYIAPVTLTAVRTQARQAEKALRRVRADNVRVERLVAEVSAKLAAAHTQRDFATMRTLHTESYGCADSVYAHYRSVQESLNTMTHTVRRVRMARWQPAGAVVRAVNRGARTEAAQLRVATAGLAATVASLQSETARNRKLVDQLNIRTADVKHRIRDGYGAVGLRWFEDLEARREAARAAEGKPLRAAR
ncbi:hypothetical protein [Micromonospora sp. KC723]|uniref:hypothetical protein n=1 Tax=Micromonospora sp. KC723 TaxID=2530381 RepID=UPI001052EE40|nr:hypothetical protein [Micromonospora sp. KC723]TDB74757.1 hypothetical protein E1165_13685 [Micromonospora sp. KC723]